MSSESERCRLLFRRACRTECALTGTDSGQQAGVIWRTVAIQEWIIKAWPNADTHPAFGEDAEAAGEKVFFALLCGHGHMDQREG